MTRVAVALSGGVDSSVTAYLLKKQGYDVVTITGKMVLSQSSDIICNNAKNVADYLGLEHHILDLSKDFNDYVIEYFKNAYKKGETPNPCIMCNKYIKWGKLFDYAVNELNCDYIATGHYANIINADGYYKLFPAKDVQKDQLYFLFQLNQSQLSKTMFPLKDLEKTEIRQIALDNNLPSKSSKESQDICFIQKPMTTKKYLLNSLTPKKGDFIEYKTGNKLGEHDGYFQYTVGQRKGIGIAAPEPLYVVDIDAEKNIVYVGYKEDTFSSSIILNTFNSSYPINAESFDAKVKIRYNMKPVDAHIFMGESFVLIEFYKPINSVTKGQACVIYDKEDGHLLGGGFI